MSAFGDAWEGLKGSVSKGGNWLGGAAEDTWDYITGKPEGGDTKAEDYAPETLGAQSAHDLAAKAAMRYDAMRRGVARKDIGMGAESVVDSRSTAALGGIAAQQSAAAASGKAAGLAAALQRGGEASLDLTGKLGQSRGNEDVAMRNVVQGLESKQTGVNINAALAANQRAAAQRAADRAQQADQWARDRASAQGLLNTVQSGVGAAGGVAADYYATNTGSKPAEPAATKAKGYDERLGY